MIGLASLCAVALCAAPSPAPSPAPALALAPTPASAPASVGGALGELERQQQQLFARIAPAVVFIAVGQGFGSGFFVNGDGLVLTNAHVVGDSETVDVVLHDGRKLKGQVIERASGDIDLALVQTPVKGVVPPPALGGVDEVQIGSWVGAIGHGGGAIWTFNSGMISNIYPEGSERRVFQTQIPLNPGNSGGPIFDREGRVVGIVTARMTDATSINFGIGMEVARSTLTRLAASCDCLVVNAPAGIPVFVAKKMVGVGPRVVVPASAGTVYEVFAVIGGAMKKVQARYPEVREVTIQ